MTSLATAHDPTTLPADVRDVLAARFPAAAALPVQIGRAHV